MVPVIYHGSCLCDSITFDIEGEPEKVFSCYCLDCAKNSGGPYQLVCHVRAPLNQIQLLILIGRQIRREQDYC